MVLSGDGWTRERVRARHQGVEQSGGSCVLILVTFWLDLALREDAEGRFLVCVSQAGMRLPVRYVGGGAFPQNKYRSSTLVGLRHPEMALQAAFRTGSIFEAIMNM